MNMPVAGDVVEAGFSLTPFAVAISRVFVGGVVIGFSSSLLHEVSVNPMANKAATDKRAFFLFIKRVSVRQSISLQFDRVAVGLTRL